MRKLGLLLITLITLTSVSYASFPITDTLQTEEIEPSNSFYIFLSILSALGAIIFAFLTLGSGMMHTADPSIVTTYLLLTLLSIGGAVFSAIQAKKKGASWSKALLGVGIVVLVASFFLIGM